MHNEYITTCCITDERDKLLLLKYTDVDITKLCPVLVPLTSDLFDQYYNQVDAFHKLNKEKNKKYNKIEENVVEYMKDMLFIKKKFLEYFKKSCPKTKEDLLIYVFAYQISNNRFNEYLYRVLVAALKQEVNQDFWRKYRLEDHELISNNFKDSYFFSKDGVECNTGEFLLDINPSLENINQYNLRKNYNLDLTLNKLEIIRKIGLIMDNYYNDDFAMFNEPFKDSILDLVNHIKVDRDLEKPKQLIKRI